MIGKDIIKEEFEKRIKCNDDVYELLGTELKRRRTSQSQTLSAIASDVCSVSYLCKVERNQLKPNKHMLKEICKRLNIESPKIDVLFQMQELINLEVENYIDGNIEALDETYAKCEHLDNYKTHIIKLIYLLGHKKLAEANTLVRELIKLVSLMKDYELNIFAIFQSVLMFYQENYLEALDNLLMIEQREKDDKLVLFVKQSIFSCYYKLNHPLTLKYGEELSKWYFNSNDLSNMDSVRYYISLYYIKNNLLDESLKQLKYINNKQYKNSIRFLINIYKSKKVNVKIDNLRPFMQLVYIYLYKNSEYRQAYHNLNGDVEYDLDFSNNIAAYLLLDSRTDKHKELINIYLPSSCKSKNEFEQRFFLKELGRLCLEVGRYKNFVKAYLSMKEAR